MRPSNDTAVIRDRLDTVSYFLQPENFSLLSELQNSLKNIKELDRILVRIKGVRASINDWKNLHQVNKCAMKCTIL